MRRCDGACAGAAGKLQGRGGGGLEGPGWSSRKIRVRVRSKQTYCYMKGMTKQQNKYGMGH